MAQKWKRRVPICPIGLTWPCLEIPPPPPPLPPLDPSLTFLYFCRAPLADLPAEAESGDAAVPVPVVAAAAPAPVQPGAGAPEDAAGRAADGAPEARAASARGPLLLHAGHGARQAARPEGKNAAR